MTDTPIKFYGVYKDEDGWFRFNIKMQSGDLLKSGEYEHSKNADFDRSWCCIRNSIDNIETTLITGKDE
jgi:hypothetical protein